MKRQYFE